HETDGSWAECFVALGRDFFDALASLGAVAPRRPVLDPGVAPSLVERFQKILEDLSALPGRELPRVLVGIHELLVDVRDLDRRGVRPDAHAAAVEEACRMLGADLAARLSVPAVAARLGVGYERFRKIFRERVGVSPGEYRIRRRLERARAMLTAGEMSVKEVAFALGYPNAFAFSRQFAKYTGAPPSHFLRAP
ncbi:MAG: helix-turn-helix domain-containing protein, partial [Planctomycetota bacterium]